MFERVVDNLEFMQTLNLKIEYLNYIVKAFSLACEPKFLASFKEYNETMHKIEMFIPKLIH